MHPAVVLTTGLTCIGRVVESAAAVLQNLLFQRVFRLLDFDIIGQSPTHNNVPSNGVDDEADLHQPISRSGPPLLHHRLAWA